MVIVEEKAPEMFWGITVDEGKKYTQTAETAFHISMAALEPAEGNDTDIASVMLVHNNAEFLLCTLKQGSLYQQPLDLNFTEGESLTLYTTGKGTVHLSGYRLHDQEEMDGDDSMENLVAGEDFSEEDISDDDASPTQAALLPKKQQKLPVAEALDEVDSDASDDDDDDSVDIDDMMGIGDDYSNESDDSEGGEEDDEDDEEDDEDDEEESEDGEESEDEVAAPPAKQSKKQQINGNPGHTPTNSGDGKQFKKQTPNQGQPTLIQSKKTPKVQKPQNQEQKSPKQDQKTPKQEQKTPKNEKKTQKNEKKTPKNELKTLKPEHKSQKPEQKIPPQAKESGTPQKRKLPSGIIVEDLKLGHGPDAKMNRMVHVYYTGKLQNGKVFDKTDSGKPFSFRLGKGEVIKGWEIGIQGMKVGGKRRLSVPPNMGYGQQKQGPIPANSTLVFDVELKSLS